MVTSVACNLLVRRSWLDAVSKDPDFDPVSRLMATDVTELVVWDGESNVSEAGLKLSWYFHRLRCHCSYPSSCSDART